MYEDDKLANCVLIHHFASLGSTNDEAKKKHYGKGFVGWDKGIDPAIEVIVADGQKTGKGRGNRRWFSQVGNALTFSVVIPRDMLDCFSDRTNGANERAKNIGDIGAEGEEKKQEEALREREKKMPADESKNSLEKAKDDLQALGAFVFCTALCVVDWLRLLSIPASIKWPNDILVEGKKIGGILLEKQDEKLIVGIGINVRGTLPPKSLLGVHSFSPTHLEKELVKNKDSQCDEMKQLSFGNDKIAKPTNKTSLELVGEKKSNLKKTGMKNQLTGTSRLASAKKNLALLLGEEQMEYTTIAEDTRIGSQGHNDGQVNRKDKNIREKNIGDKNLKVESYGSINSRFSISNVDLLSSLLFFLLKGWRNWNDRQSWNNVDMHSRNEKDVTSPTKRKRFTDKMKPLSDIFNPISQEDRRDKDTEKRLDVGKSTNGLNGTNLHRAFSNKGMQSASTKEKGLYGKMREVMSYQGKIEVIFRKQPISSHKKAHESIEDEASPSYEKLELLDFDRKRAIFTSQNKTKEKVEKTGRKGGHKKIIYFDDEFPLV